MLCHVNAALLTFLCSCVAACAMCSIRSVNKLERLVTDVEMMVSAYGANGVPPPSRAEDISVTDH